MQGDRWPPRPHFARISFKPERVPRAIALRAIVLLDNMSRRPAPDCILIVVIGCYPRSSDPDDDEAECMIGRRGGAVVSVLPGRLSYRSVSCRVLCMLSMTMRPSVRRSNAV